MLKEKIDIFIEKNYKNKRTNQGVKASLKFMEDWNEIDIEAINEYITSMSNKGNSKNLHMAHIRVFVKWHNMEYDTNHKIHHLERFVDDREQKQSYSEEEWNQINNLLIKYNKPVFRFLFLMQWANACRASELLRVDWTKEENWTFMINVSKTKDRLIERMILIPDNIREDYLKLLPKLSKSDNIQVYKNEFTRFSKFVKENIPTWNKQLSSHCLRADKITKMAAAGMTIQEIMSITRHQQTETLFKHYINESKITMRMNLERAQMDVVDGLDIKKYQEERSILIQQVLHLKQQKLAWERERNELKNQIAELKRIRL